MSIFQAIVVVIASEFADSFNMPTSRRFQAAHRLAHRTLDVGGY
jgi:hypothetical protein